MMGGQQGNVALLSGGSGVSSVGEHDELPDAFSVGQNYPNPFNPTTTIEVTLPVQCDMTVRIFDVLGREVRSFEYEKTPAGVHKIVWDGTNQHGTSVASGVYFYHVRLGEKTAVRRMLMLR
jgi:flagellar hook assembly protein FlgD